MSPPPRPGEVIAYAYLWTHEHDAGREDAAKDRPCAVVVSVRHRDDDIVYVLPITSRPPVPPEDGIEVPRETRKRLGLQAAPCWIVLTEVNRFVWPGPDLRPIANPVGAAWSYGLLPAKLFTRVRDAMILRARERRLRAVGRTE